MPIPTRRTTTASTSRPTRATRGSTGSTTGLSSVGAPADDRLRRRARPGDDQRADQGDRRCGARRAVSRVVRRPDDVPVRRGRGADPDRGEPEHGRGGARLQPARRGRRRACPGGRHRGRRAGRRPAHRVRAGRPALPVRDRPRRHRDGRSGPCYAARRSGSPRPSRSFGRLPGDGRLDPADHGLEPVAAPTKVGRR